MVRVRLGSSVQPHALNRVTEGEDGSIERQVPLDVVRDLPHNDSLSAPGQVLRQVQDAGRGKVPVASRIVRNAISVTSSSAFDGRLRAGARLIGREISTSYVKRSNLTMRMGMRRLTRLTNGFLKKLEGLGAAMTVNFMYYSFARP
jgi:hypothetical protein